MLVGYAGGDSHDAVTASGHQPWFSPATWLIVRGATRLADQQAGLRELFGSPLPKGARAPGWQHDGDELALSERALAAIVQVTSQELAETRRWCEFGDRVHLLSDLTDSGNSAAKRAADILFFLLFTSSLLVLMVVNAHQEVKHRSDYAWTSRDH